MHHQKPMLLIAHKFRVRRLAPNLVCRSAIAHLPPLHFGPRFGSPCPARPDLAPAPPAPPGQTIFGNFVPASPVVSDVGPGPAVGENTAASPTAAPRLRRTDTRQKWDGLLHVDLSVHSFRPRLSHAAALPLSYLVAYSHAQFSAASTSDVPPATPALAPPVLVHTNNRDSPLSPASGAGWPFC